MRTQVVTTAAGVERWVCMAVAVAAAALVACEIAILFAGVVARYFLHTPLTWSDELAGILFLWLAMLGSVLALQRGEHMRMGGLVDGKGETRKAWADALGLVVATAFLGVLLPQAWDYVIHEIDVVTPVLEVSAAWRGGALALGLALMFLVNVLKIIQSPDWKRLLVLCGALIAAGIVFRVAAPFLSAMGNYQLIVYFIVLVGGAVLAGIPIAYAFGIGAFSYLALATQLPLTIVINRMEEGMSHIILLAIPMFVILGMLIEITGMARLMVGLLAALVGNVRGGLQYVLVGAMYLVSGISGSKAADMAAVMPVLQPEMKRRGVPEGESVALLAATGAQTETIPPSLVLITVGSVSGVSIAALFTGGLLPALLLGLILCGVVGWRTRHDVKTAIARASWSQLGMMLLVALPGLALPFLIRAAVIEGVATATEVSTLGVVYALAYGAVVALFFRQPVSMRRILTALVSTATLSGAILLIIGTATAMAWALTQSGFSGQLGRAMSGLPGGAFTFMAASVILFIVLGSVLEGIPAVVLFGPLLFPIARMLHIHEVHYAIVAVVAMGIGLFAPPFGYGYYVACAIGRVEPSAAVKPIMGYLLALFVGLIFIAAIPWISIGFL